MNLLEFIRTIFRNWKLLVLFPLLTAGIVLFLTRNLKKEYVSKTQVYTGIASGYGITSGEDDRIDYFAVNNAFDNLMATINSRESIEEVGMRLLAKHLLVKKPGYKELSEENFNSIREILPEKLRQQLIVEESEELTFLKIESYKKSTENNEIVELLNTPCSIYNLDAIASNMSALRKQSSDMIEISYKSNDPAVCQQTLQFIVDVVISRYKGIKGQETNNVVEYFEDQLRQSAMKLRQSEDRLRDYSSQNKIINYYEQAKFVAESKEKVTEDRQKQEEFLDASKAALKKVEQKIEMKKNILEVNAKLAKLKEQLSESTYKIANAELYNEDRTLLTQYRADAEKLKKSIKEEIEKQYNLYNTSEGMPRANMLNEWLSNYLAVDENEAKLKVIIKRLESFDGIYKELAPVGSNLKRIEREVEINEKEYLNVLHGLNMAKLRQQSLAMSNNLSITDFPFLPLKPEPSKKIILVIMAFVATFILTLAFIVAKSLLGKTVQSPSRAEKYTGLKFLSAFPNYKQLDATVNIEELSYSILSHFRANFAIHHNDGLNRPNEPVIITLSSIKKGEGKTFIGKKIVDKLTENFSSILYISTEELSFDNSIKVESIRYTQDENYKRTRNISDWFLKLGVKKSDYDIIFIELEELSKFSIPNTFLNGVNSNLLVLSAERVWSESDSSALKLFTSLADVKPMILLNRVELDRLEAIIGEIPKRRSIVRRITKKVVTFEFEKA